MDSADKQTPKPLTADAGALGVWRELSRQGWMEVIGLELVAATAAEVVAQWSVGPRHLR